MRKLAPIRWAYCASPGYLHKKGIPGKRVELVDHDCLIYPGLTPTIKVTDEQDRQHQFKLRTPIQANSSLVLLVGVRKSGHRLVAHPFDWRSYSEMN
jgi:DNA-binding transcriptional LysR family regulator